MHGSLTPSTPRSLLQLNHSHPVKPVSSPRGVLLTKWSLSQFTHNLFRICDNRLVLLWSRAKAAFKGAPGGSFFHLCVCAAPPQLRRSLVLENEAGPIRQTVYFQTNSVWPAASHTHIPILPDRLSEAGYKGTGVVKTWHSQKRPAGPKVNRETSHMTQCCRNDRTARVSDEGPWKDIASPLYFCPTALISEIILWLPWVQAGSIRLSGPAAQGYLSSAPNGGKDVSRPSLDHSTGPTSELLRLPR